MPMLRNRTHQNICFANATSGIFADRMRLAINQAAFSMLGLKVPHNRAQLRPRFDGYQVLDKANLQILEFNDKEVFR
jgi:hypothetical protein